LSSRWIVGQSGCASTSRLAPPIGSNNNASNAASVISAASGHVSAARSIRFKYSLAVLCPTPRLVAIFRVDNPPA